MTIIDPSTGWFKIVEISNKTAENVGRTLNHAWFLRYLHLVQCACDNRNEFLGEGFQEILKSYSIEPKLTIVKNP